MQKAGYPAIADPYEGTKDYSAKVGALSYAVGVTMSVKQYAGDNLIGIIVNETSLGKVGAYVVHAEEKGHCQDNTGIPRQDREGHED